jgi:hypothetical protein
MRSERFKNETRKGKISTTHGRDKLQDALATERQGKTGAGTRPTTVVRSNPKSAIIRSSGGKWEVVSTPRGSDGK